MPFIPDQQRIQGFQQTSRFIPDEIQQPKKLGFFQRVQSDIKKRAEILATGIESKQAGLETGVQLAGQAAGLGFDIGGQLLSSLSNIIPGFIKKPVTERAKQATKAVLNTPVGQAGLQALTQGIDTYRSWKSQNPRTARDLESVVNIAMVFPAGRLTGIAGKKALTTTGELAGKAATKLETGLAKQTFNEALDIIKPVLTLKEKGQALEAGRGIVTEKILPRRFEKISVVSTAREKEMADVVKGIVSKSKNPIDNIMAIQNEIGIQEGFKSAAIKGYNTIFNKAQLKTVLNKAKEGSQVVFGSDKALQSSYNSVVDEMMRQAGKESSNLSGLLQARKNFDNVINQKFPGLLSNPIGDTAKQNAVRDVRRAVNEFIANKLPVGNEFKSVLRKQNLMYDAIENIGKKTASAVDASAVRKVMTLLRANPLTSFATGGILTYGAMIGMFSNPIVIGTIVLGGSIKLGKTIVTSRILRQSLISVLRALEIAGKTDAVEAIKSIINQLPLFSQ